MSERELRALTFLDTFGGRRVASIPIAVVLAVSVFGLAVELGAAQSPPVIVWGPDLVVGIVLAVVGAGLMRLGAQPLAGVMFMAAGATWFAGNLVGLGLTGEVSAHLIYVHRGLVLAGVVLLRTSIGSRFAAVAFVVSTWVAWLTTPPVGVLVWVGGVVTLTIGVTWHWPSRARAWGATAIVLTCASAGSVAVLSLLGNRAGRWSEEATWGYDACLVLAGVAALAAAADLVARPTTVADAVLRVALEESGPLRQLLVRALRDPDLELAFATDAGGWVDEAGSERARVSASGDRDRVMVKVGERVVAELSCRADMARAAPVMRGVEGATRLVAQNAVLRASLLREADDLRDSQRRLLLVLDHERRALEARLAATVVGPLAVLDRSLSAIRRGTDESVDAAVERCRSRQAMLKADLDHLAAGLGPASLTASGLAAAIETLTSSLDLPVSLAVDSSAFEPVLATTAYLVCAEAVANVIKHADATRLDVSIVVRQDQLEVMVVDDGRGGARSAGGTGLAGLTDRVTALGGVLTLSSPVGGPTTLRTVLPLGHTPPIRVQRMP